MTASVTPRDRLGLTLILALVVHAIVVLGVGFSFERRPSNALPTLDVILVQARTTDSPEQADFLANAAQVGGGDSERAVRPTQPFSSPIPKPEPGIAPVPIPAGAPEPQPPAPAPDVVLVQQHAEQAVAQRQSRPEQPPVPQPARSEMVQRELEMARLAAEIHRSTEAYAKRPRRKFISANTREHAYATYMHAWVTKVERVGNLNYPLEARRQGLHGELVLTVAIRRDGSVESVDVIKPSGHSVLDDGAVQIVHMAAPFAPLPRTEDGVDVLHITRTWQFLPGNVLRYQ